jgi:hypothetical protein
LAVTASGSRATLREPLSMIVESGPRIFAQKGPPDCV